MPKRPRSHELEDASRNRLHRAFESKGWTVEDLAKDYGEDLLVRIFDAGAATPLSFFVQAKATDNLARYLNSAGGRLTYPVGTEHLGHWNRFWEPIILTLWDSQSEITYWECVQNALESGEETSPDLSKPKSARLSIPVDNILDDRGIRRIYGITKTRFKRLKREQEGAQILIDLLKREAGIDIQYWPQSGLLTIQQPGKEGVQIVMFGKMAAGYSKLAQSLNLSPQGAFECSMDLIKQAFGAYADGHHIAVMNPATGKIERQWRTLDELVRHLEAEAEVDAADADEPA
jgi:hypothetical protein